MSTIASTNRNEMQRREFLKISGAIGAGLLTLPRLAPAAEAGDSPAGAPPGGKNRLPNFVIYMSDDHGMRFSEPYGNVDVRTPNLARLAAEGMRFTHAFNAAPCCGPSRSAMLTGLWPCRNGAIANHMPPQVGTGLPGVLRALGYETAAFGKVAHNDFIKYYPFDKVAGPSLGAIAAGELGAWLSTRDASRPLCLFFGSHYPHTGWLQNRDYDPAALNLPPDLADTPVMREQLANYYTSVSATDALLGEVRSLVQRHVPGETAFLYTADHGAQLPFAKWDLYDAGTRLPFIMSWPGRLPPGTTHDATICLPDLLPTLIELAGGQVPAGLDGQSFAGVLRGTTRTHRDHTFALQSGDGNFNVYPSRSLRTHRWKYILNLHPEFQHHTHISISPNAAQGILYWKSWQAAAETRPDIAAVVNRYLRRPAEELYDLEADPYELHNVAQEAGQAKRLASMRADLKAWMHAQGDEEKIYGRPILLTDPVPNVTVASSPPRARRQRSGP